MKTGWLGSVTAATLFAALAMPVWTAAQDSPSQEHKPKHHTYTLIDLGTFGGAASAANDQINGYRDLNEGGDIVGYAETLVPLNQYSNGFACFPGPDVNHGLRYQDGHTTDLGALSPSSTNCSNAQSINDSGEIGGVSENGQIDPVLGTNQIRAVMWKHGVIADLGTLGGIESSGGSINNRHQVVGFSTNTIPDPYSFFYLLSNNSNGTQTRAYLWRDGAIQDLGTLGGPDAAAVFINQRGQVAGFSYTNSTPNPTTGIPTQDPFLWHNGTMQDLGTLGGTLGGPNGMNDRGQVVGVSNVAGDQSFHPFLWDGNTLLDLGTLGGSTGTAVAINDDGEVAGFADLPVSGHDAFLWKEGVMTDLGNLGVTSATHAISSKGQVIGASRVGPVGDARAFLWENGGPMVDLVDLNTLIPANSSLTLTFAETINERGEIGGTGVPTGCAPKDTTTCGHAFLLIPNGECDYECEGRIAASHTAAMQQQVESPTETINQVRNSLSQRYRFPGQRSAPRD